MMPMAWSMGVWECQGGVEVVSEVGVLSEPGGQGDRTGGLVRVGVGAGVVPE